MRVVVKFRMLDLFSGIGGFALAAQWVWGGRLEIVSFCETDKQCQEIIIKHFPYANIVFDVREIVKVEIDSVELVSGGDPCPVRSKARYDSRDNYIFDGKEGLRILTGKERVRFAGFPEGWLDGFSESAVARMTGNAVAPPVAAVIMNALKEADSRD